MSEATKLPPTYLQAAHAFLYAKQDGMFLGKYEKKYAVMVGVWGGGKYNSICGIVRGRMKGTDSAINQPSIPLDQSTRIRRTEYTRNWANKQRKSN